MDQSLGGRDTSDACRLLLMPSLANVPKAVLGLSMPTMIAYLAELGRDIARLKTNVLEKLATAAWYLHSDRDGKLYFKNVQNLNAKNVLIDTGKRFPCNTGARIRKGRPCWPGR
jgi:hypothetical protein